MNPIALPFDLSDIVERCKLDATGDKHEANHLELVVGASREAQASDAGNVAEPPPRPGSQGRAEGPPPPPSTLQIALPFGDDVAPPAPRARKRRAA